MKLTTDIKKCKKLTNNEINIMNHYRQKEYGAKEIIDFKKEDAEGIFFLVKDNNRLVAFGMLKPINIEYLGNAYHILGMGRGMAIKKGMGYGRILNAARIYYIKKTGKTSVAFTGRENLPFFEKIGFQTSKNLIRRFGYKNPRTGEIKIDNDGYGVYYEGKDKFVSKLLSKKGIAYTNVPFW